MVYIEPEGYLEVINNKPQLKYTAQSSKGRIITTVEPIPISQFDFDSTKKFKEDYTILFTSVFNCYANSLRFYFTEPYFMGFDPRDIFPKNELIGLLNIIYFLVCLSKHGGGYVNQQKLVCEISKIQDYVTTKFQSKFPNSHFVQFPKAFTYPIINFNGLLKNP